MLAINTVLQDRYLIVRQIGQGGMGAVYEARHTQLRNTVAVKEIIATDDIFRKALEREARLLANLRHSSLPKVIDHFTEGNSQFLVMEFIPGYDLFELIQLKGSSFPCIDVMYWGEQLLNVLSYLHAQHPPVIHRDIKPHNLKVTDRNEIILLDFGLAKGEPMMSRITSGSSIFGFSLNYAPPEQMQGIGTDARSDLYSVAATLYHLMTNTCPPDALTRAMTLASGKPDLLHLASDINSQVPSNIAFILYKAMSLNQNERPASAESMLRMLRQKSKNAESQKSSHNKSIAKSTHNVAAYSPQPLQEIEDHPTQKHHEKNTQAIINPKAARNERYGQPADIVNAPIHNAFQQDAYVGRGSSPLKGRETLQVNPQQRRDILMIIAVVIAAIGLILVITSVLK